MTNSKLIKKLICTGKPSILLSVYFCAAKDRNSNYTRGCKNQISISIVDNNIPNDISPRKHKTLKVPGRFACKSNIYQQTRRPLRDLCPSATANILNTLSLIITILNSSCDYRRHALSFPRTDTTTSINKVL